MAFDEQQTGSGDNPHPDIGQRAWSLQEAKGLETELGFSTSNFTVIPRGFFEDIDVDGADFNVQTTVDAVNRSNDIGLRATHPRLVAYFMQRLIPHLAELREFTERLGGDDVIIRPSPLDEYARSDISFAGAYKGYMPTQNLGRDGHLVHGTAEMLAGRFTKYGNYYYARHGLDTARKVGAICMEPFFDINNDTPLFHGTAYIAGDHIRNEYNVASGANRPRPRLVVERDNQIWSDEQDAEASIDFNSRMSKVLRGLQKHFGIPLDVEYLFDKRGDLYVVQLRKISERHLANWLVVPALDEDGLPHRSAVINSTGTAIGKVIDLRSSLKDANVDDLGQGIIVLDHEPMRSELHSQALFELAAKQNLSGLQVVIDHGGLRPRDHLQYTLGEDPGIDFIVQTTDPAVTGQLQDGKLVQITSNGITASVQ
jgi:hypothetical protein